MGSSDVVANTTSASPLCMSATLQLDSSNYRTYRELNRFVGILNLFFYTLLS